MCVPHYANGLLDEVWCIVLRRREASSAPGVTGIGGWADRSRPGWDDSLAYWPVQQPGALDYNWSAQAGAVLTRHRHPFHPLLVVFHWNIMAVCLQCQAVFWMNKLTRLLYQFTAVRVSFLFTSSRRVQDCCCEGRP